MSNHESLKQSGLLTGTSAADMLHLFVDLLMVVNYQDPVIFERQLQHIKEKLYISKLTTLG
jgi:hypothetical protein